MVVLQVKGRVGMTVDRNVLFEPARDLEHKGLILSHTVTVLRHGVCLVQAINMGDEDLFLAKGTQVGAISDATVDLSKHFKVVGAQEVQILSSPVRGHDEPTKCPIDLSNFEGSDSERQQLEALILKVTHNISLSDDTPVKQPYRRIPPAFYREVQDHLQGLLEKQIIRESSSPWASPIVLVRKKDGTLRLC
ncbi:unnamed protein product, partial [Candidula unifasciata]